MVGEHRGSPVAKILFDPTLVTVTHVTYVPAIGNTSCQNGRHFARNSERDRVDSIWCPFIDPREMSANTSGAGPADRAPGDQVHASQVDHLMIKSVPGVPCPSNSSVRTLFDLATKIIFTIDSLPQRNWALLVTKAMFSLIKYRDWLNLDIALTGHVLGTVVTISHRAVQKGPDRSAGFPRPPGARFDRPPRGRSGYRT